MLAQRILSVERSPFYSIMDLAAGREDCIYLQLGEPDFPTPKHILEAGKRALEEGFHHYSPDRGYPELRKLVAEKIRRESDADYSWEDEVFITAGGQAGLHIALMAVAEPGDEVLLLVPYYPPYLVNVLLAGATSVLVPLKPENDFTPEPEVIRGYITPKTKALVLHTPNNPTGSVYPREALEGISRLAHEHGFFIISDEVYEKFSYGGEGHVSMASFSQARDNLILVNSFSKTYAMTGWRVGYIAAPGKTLLQLLKYHHTVNICANAAAQQAAIAALTGLQECIGEMLHEYRKRRDLLVEGLNDIPGIKCPTPKGAFYAFADIRALGMPSLDLAHYLLRETGVVLANGSGFGCEGFIRFSYAADIQEIEEALKRIKEAVVGIPAKLKA